MTERFSRPWAFGLILMLLAQVGTVRASTEIPDIDASAMDSSSLFNDHLVQQYVLEYRRILSVYDHYLDDNPDALDVRIERCLFIQQIAWSESYFVEDSAAAYDECNTRLSEDHGDDPKVQIYLLNELWGEEAIARLDELLTVSYADWSDEDRFTFYKQATNILWRNGEALKAIAYARLALDIRDDPETRLILAESLISRDLPDEARTHLARIALPGDKSWLVLRQLTAWLDLGSIAEAEALMPSVDPESISGYERARIDAKLSIIRGAGEWKQVITKAFEDTIYSVDDAIGLFNYSLAHGTAETAEHTYLMLKTQFPDADLFLQHRSNLIERFDEISWSWVDAVNGWLWIVLLLAVLIVPGLIILPVHYRSLIRQRRHQMRWPHHQISRWTLKHAWLVLSFLIISDMVALAWVNFDAFANLFQDEVLEIEWAQHDLAQMFTITMLMSLGFVFLMMPWSAGVYRFGSFSVMGTIGRALCLAVLMLILNAILKRIMGVETNEIVPGGITQTMTALSAFKSEYGSLALFVAVGLAVPLIEETFFRGVLLNAMAKHISFGWANLIQALLFMVIHEEVRFYIYYATIGLVAGYMTRKSGSLMTAILTHVFINSMAALAIIHFF